MSDELMARICDRRISLTFFFIAAAAEPVSAQRDLFITGVR